MPRLIRQLTSRTLLIVLFAVLLVFSGAAAPASASVIVQESFDYATGGLNGSSGGTGWSGAWAAQSQAQVVNSALAYSVPDGGTVDGGSTALAVSASTNNALIARSLASAQSGELYLSFLFQYTSGTIGSNEFAVLWFNSNNGPNFGVKGNQGPAGEDFMFRPTGSAGGEVWAGGIDVGTTYFVVVRAYKDASTNYNRFEMWMNPAYGDSGAPTVSSNGNSGISSITSIGMRTAGLGDTLLFDEIVVGSSWADVVPAAPAPDPAPDPDPDPAPDPVDNTGGGSSSSSSTAPTLDALYPNDAGSGVSTTPATNNTGNIRRNSTGDNDDRDWNQRQNQAGIPLQSAPDWLMITETERDTPGYQIPPQPAGYSYAHAANQGYGIYTIAHALTAPVEICMLKTNAGGVQVMAGYLGFPAQWHLLPSFERQAENGRDVLVCANIDQPMTFTLLLQNAASQ